MTVRDVSVINHEGLLVVSSLQETDSSEGGDRGTSSCPGEDREAVNSGKWTGSTREDFTELEPTCKLMVCVEYYITNQYGGRVSKHKIWMESVVGCLRRIIHFREIYGIIE